MCRRILVAVAAFTLGLASPVTAQPASPCQLKRLASFAIGINSGGPIFIPVKLNNTEYSFEVDTAATFSTIDPSVAKTLHMATRKAARPHDWISNASSDTMASPDDFWVGPTLHSTHYWFYLWPEKYWKLPGTLGSDFLRSFDVDFDFAGEELNLIDPNHCPGNPAYWKPEALVTVPIDTINSNLNVRIPVVVDGRSMFATIDSGNAISFMSMSQAQTILGLDKNDATFVSSRRMIFGEMMTVYSYPFRSIRISGSESGAGVTIDNPKILILEDAAVPGVKGELFLGINTLRQLHIYIAYKEHKMYLSPAQKSPEAVH